MTETAIIPRRINGSLCVAAHAGTIRPALRGTQPLTITHGHATGEQVWLTPRREQTWANDGITVQTADIADTLDHPEHGEILTAYVDTDRLGPILAGIDATHRAKQAAADRAAEARVAAAIPACHNCGDCPKCC